MKKVILVVDDDLGISSFLEITLQNFGFTVIVANDGQSGFERALKEKPNLIILDEMMPILDGFSMNLKLKENPETKDIPVIISTGKAKLEGLFGTIKNSHVNDFLTKPYTIDALLSKIQKII